MSDPMTGSAIATASPVIDTAGQLNGEQPGSASRDKPRGLLGDAWYDLCRKPLFWISAAIILLFLVMAAFPSLFTSADPAYATLDRSLGKPSGDAWFGYDQQGADVYARVIYGAQASIIVALTATFGTVLLGAAIGIFAGFKGGWIDSLLSRGADIFFGLPFVLGAIVILFTFNPPGSSNSKLKIMLLVIVSLIVLGWPVSMRIMRSTVLATKEADYIMAARALGAGTGRIVLKHLLPNCLAPVLVYATILIGAYITAEATLSFLGVGLKPPVVSWGVMISESQNLLRLSPNLLYFPAAFLVLAVLSFVMLGEAVREALDPKLR